MMDAGARVFHFSFMAEPETKLDSSQSRVYTIRLKEVVEFAFN